MQNYCEQKQINYLLTRVQGALPTIAYDHMAWNKLYSSYENKVETKKFWRIKGT